MKIEVNNQFSSDGKEFYYWTLFDGPEGKDEVKGFATDLIEVFSKILEWRERIGQDYANQVLEDIKTIETFLKTDNETNPD